MKNKLQAYLSLHFCVFLWGFTAILGKLINLNAIPLVWWRVFLASATLFFLIPRRKLLSFSRKLWLRLILIGSLVGVHWICFYAAVKLSNASVAVATMATTSFFAAIAEPIITRQKVKWYELGLGLLILPGMALVIGTINWDMQIGFGLGILGALIASVFNSLNKEVVEKYSPAPLLMSFVQLSAATLICSVFIPFLLWHTPETRLMPSSQDWIWLLVLTWLCTLLTHYLTLQALRHISAFGTILTINLEPIYGVLLAALIFREDKELGPNFYLGMLIILLAVFSHPFLKSFFEKEPIQPPN
ncbi:MAG: DMT family transporter [Saprospiraceae bacterium]|nr:DMT family transporter [Lewinellaceae bacterium]